MRKARGGKEEEESEWSSGTVGLKVTGGILDINIIFSFHLSRKVEV